MINAFFSAARSFRPHGAARIIPSRRASRTVRSPGAPLFRLPFAPLFVLPTLFLLLQVSVSAQDTAAEEEADPAVLAPIEVSVEAPHEEAAALPAQVTVITAEEIAASEARSVAEMIASVAGVGIEKYGNITQPGFVSIRGSSSEQILILVDGVRINSAQGGGVDLNTIPLDSIERIEIIRGGGGALYGEGALSGIINIVTKGSAAEKPAASMYYSFGSFNTHRAGVRVEGPLGSPAAAEPAVTAPPPPGLETGGAPESPPSWHYALSGGGYYTEGNYSYPDDYEEGGVGERLNADGYSVESTARIEGKTGRDGPSLAILCQGGFRETGVPGLLEFPSETARMNDASVVASISADSSLTSLGRFSGDLSAAWRTRNYTDSGWYLGAVDDTHSTITAHGGVSLSREDRWGMISLRSAAGSSIDFDLLDSTALVADSGLTGSGVISRFTEGLYSNFALSLFTGENGTGRIVVTPAVRYDASQTIQAETDERNDQGDWSWGAGAAVRLDEAGNWLLKGNAGSSYRMPGFNDLFWPATSFAAGNPGLLPEEALFWDAGISLQPIPYLKLQGAWFSQRIENLIQWNPGPAGQWTPENIGMADIRGLECEASVMVPLFGGTVFGEIDGNYTYLRAVDMTEGSATYGKQLTRRPFERANCALSLSHQDGHSLQVSGQYVGYRYTTAMNTKTIPAYFVMNAAVTVVIREWEFSLSCVNLLDTPYINLEEYPVPGREIQIEGRLKL